MIIFLYSRRGRNFTHQNAEKIYHVRFDLSCIMKRKKYPSLGVTCRLLFTLMMMNGVGLSRSRKKSESHPGQPQTAEENN